MTFKVIPKGTNCPNYWSFGTSSLPFGEAYLWIGFTDVSYGYPPVTLITTMTSCMFGIVSLLQGRGYHHAIHTHIMIFMGFSGGLSKGKILIFPAWRSIP